MKDTNELRDIIENMKIGTDVSLKVSNVLIDLINHIDCLENKLDQMHREYICHHHSGDISYCK